MNFKKKEKTAGSYEMDKRYLQESLEEIRQGGS
jgi:hypothetical protein